MLKDRKNLDKLGYKLHFMIDCSWSNEEWNFFGVEEWPSIEALEKRAKFEYEEIEAHRYVETGHKKGSVIITVERNSKT